MKSLPVTSIVRNFDGSWTFAWTATGLGPYRIVLLGITLATVTDPTFVWADNGYLNYPPPLEIMDGNKIADSELNDPTITIEWNRVDGSAGYSIERHVGSSWLRVGTIDESGQATYRYQTSPLANGTVCQLRVVAEDSLGNRSSPVYFTKTVTCSPLVPDQSIQVAYAPGTITISAA